MSPPPAKHLVPRPRLLQALGGSWKVAVLSAPAGYGKTTLALQYAEGRDVLWCRLHPEDGDTARLLRTLLAGGRRSRRPVGKRTELLLEAGRDMERDGEILFASWLREFHPARGERLVVLDEAHAITGSAAAERWLLRMIEESGPRVRFLLACQGECPLPLDRLNLDAPIVRLEASDLEFDREEEERLYTNGFELSLREVERDAIRTAFGGWAAGLAMAAERARRISSSGGSTALAAGTGIDDIDAFFESEVYAPLPKPLREALLRLALLDDLEQEAVRVLLGAPEATRVLREIRRRGLFLQTPVSAGTAPRFQPLFRDFLRSRARQEVRRSILETLLERLSAYFLARGEPSLAVRAFVDAGVETGAPMLLLHAAYQARNGGRHEEALRHARDAADEFLACRDHLHAARAFSIEARSAILTGRVRESLRHGRRLLDRVLARRHDARGLVGYHLASLLLHAGKPAEARRQSVEAERLLARAGLEIERAEATVLTATVDYTRGRWDLYLLAARRVLPTFRRAGYVSRAETLLINMAEAANYLGDPDLAIAHLDEARSLAPRSGAAYNRASEPLVRAAALAARGEYDAAGRELQRAREETHHFGTAKMELSIEYQEGLLARRRGDLDGATRHLRRALDGFEALEIPSWIILARMELALATGLGGRRDDALRELAIAARGTRALGDVKELARNELYEARLRQLDGGAWEAPFLRAVRSLDRDQYLQLLRRESDVAIPLVVSFAGTAGRGRDMALARRALAAIPEELLTARASTAPAGTSVSLRMLGDFELRLDGRVVRIPRRASEALIAYLALRRGSPVAWEVAAEALWPGAPAHKSRNRFDVALTVARRAVEPEAGPRGPFRVITTDAGLCRIVPGMLSVDVSTFEDAARTAEPALELATDIMRSRSGRPGGVPALTRIADARDCVAAALSLAGGDLLPGFPYAPWTEAERERLRDRRHRLLLGYGVLSLASGNAPAAAETAAKVLADDALHEDAERLLLEALAAQGQRGAVVRNYRRFARRLLRELGTQASPEISAIAGRMTAKKPGAGP